MKTLKTRPKTPKTQKRTERTERTENNHSSLGETKGIINHILTSQLNRNKSMRRTSMLSKTTPGKPSFRKSSTRMVTPPLPLEDDSEIQETKAIVSALNDTKFRVKKNSALAKMVWGQPFGDEESEFDGKIDLRLLEEELQVQFIVVDTNFASVVCSDDSKQSIDPHTYMILYKTEDSSYKLVTYDGRKAFAKDTLPGPIVKLLLQSDTCRVPLPCNDTEDSQYTDANVQALQHQYEHCCPKSRIFHRKSRTPYCRRLDKTITAKRGEIFTYDDIYSFPHQSHRFHGTRKLRPRKRWLSEFWKWFTFWGGRHPDMATIQDEEWNRTH